MLNIDYKIVKGRNISENTRTLLDILDYLKQTNKPGILINIDFEKAFDSIEWAFYVGIEEI